MNSEKIQQYISDITDWAVVFVPKVFLAAIILYIGFKILKRVNKMVYRVLEAANVGPEISEFLASILNIALKFIVILIAAGIVGVKISALLGVLAAAGFAVGLALQGFLGNFASGLTIIFFKPYKVGDWVQLSDSFGRVKSIQIFNTTLITPNDKTLVIPNGQVTDSIITNFSTLGRIRLELNVTMPYEESFPRIKQIILKAMKDSKYILHEPDPLVGIESYDSHSIVLAVRPYIVPDNYWEATFEVYELIKNAFNNNKIKVAYSEGVELGPIGD